MRALVQRVSRASVTVGDEIIGQIEAGLVVLLGLSRTDTEQDARYIVGKTVNLRVFPDDEGRFDRSPLDVGAGLGVVNVVTIVIGNPSEIFGPVTGSGTVTATAAGYAAGSFTVPP